MKMGIYNIVHLIKKHLKNIFANLFNQTAMDKICSVEDLFKDDSKCVYHFFPLEDKESILRNGLLCECNMRSKRGEKKGTYVVWSDDERVKSAIAETQASVRSNHTIVKKLCLLTINLKKYGITVEDIAPDLNGGGRPDLNSFCCKIVKDIKSVDENDITEWNGGNSDTYGIEFYNLEGYNIAHKPQDFDNNVANGIYTQLIWKSY